MIEVRYSSSPSSVETAHAADLRAKFLVDDLFVTGEVHGTYTHDDRLVVGGAVPGADQFELPAWEEVLGAGSHLEGRELGIINVADSGHVLVDGEKFELDHLDGLYVGRGSEVVFAGADAAFYFVSAPAHATYPTTLLEHGSVEPVSLGSALGANERSLFRYAWGQDLQTAALQFGVTVIADGSVWNTFPRTCTTAVPRSTSTSTSTRPIASSTSWVSPGRPATSWSPTSRRSSRPRGRSTPAPAPLLRLRVGDDRREQRLHRPHRGRRGGPVSTPFDLTGRTAVVTGAGRGLGQGVALGLARAGADLVLVGLPGSQDETAKMIVDLGREAQVVDLDMGDHDAVARVGTELAAGRPVDILVSNAGIIEREDTVDVTADSWNRVVDINLSGLFFLTQQLGRPMVERGHGKIVSIASLLAFQGGIRVISYTAAKHGVAGITKALANEWGPHGVQVNAIAPGYMATDNTTALREDADRAKAILGRIPPGAGAHPTTSPAPRSSSAPRPPTTSTDTSSSSTEAGWPADPHVPHHAPPVPLTTFSDHHRRGSWHQEIEDQR